MASEIAAEPPLQMIEVTGPSELGVRERVAWWMATYPQAEYGTLFSDVSCIDGVWSATGYRTIKEGEKDVTQA